jgi:hypothetical protein
MRTSNEAQLVINDRLEFAFGDAVWRKYVSSERCLTRTRSLTAIEQDALRISVIRFPVLSEHVLELIK